MAEIGRSITRTYRLQLHHADGEVIDVGELTLQFPLRVAGTVVLLDPPLLSRLADGFDEAAATLRRKASPCSDYTGQAHYTRDADAHITFTRNDPKIHVTASLYDRSPEFRETYQVDAVCPAHPQARHLSARPVVTRA